MNRRQILYWCHGDYAAALYLGRNTSAKRSPPYEVPETMEIRETRIRRLVNLSYLKKLMCRLGFLYADGTVDWTPGIATTGTSLDPFSYTSSVSFVSKPVSPCIGANSTHHILCDDQGYLLSKMPAPWGQKWDYRSPEILQVTLRHTLRIPSVWIEFKKDDL